MNSRERVKKALNHEVTDRVPVDFGSSLVSSAHAISMINLRKHLGLEERLPKIIEPMMFLAETDDDIREALEVDVIGIFTKGTLLGYNCENYKPWQLPNGIKVLMGEGFQAKRGDNGYYYAYPQGDTSVPPSAHMSDTGYYFDNIIRQENLETKTIWNAREDYKNDYVLLTDEELREIEKTTCNYFDNTEYAIFGNFWSGGYGDNLAMPGAFLKDPKGVRDLSDWFITLCERPEYAKEKFQMQMEILLENLKMLYEAVGNKIDVLAHTGADFGAQCGPSISPDMFRELFKPFHKTVNEWIHKNTKWKTFMHTCGSIVALLPDIIDSGMDVINPVQISAYGMDAESLKSKFGDQIVFWGGGCSPQGALSHGTPEEVYNETRKNAAIFSKNGGFIGANVHNLQYEVKPENFLAQIKAYKDTSVIAK